MIKINYQGSGNNSQFTYDGLQCNVKILEFSAGTLSSTKQFVWSKNTKYEVRDATGNLTSAISYQGEYTGSNKYFYGLDHVGSTETVTDSAGNLVASFCYSPFGTVQQVSGTFQPNILFTGFYSHNRSGLFISQTRQYNSNLGRWLSRDPLQELKSKNLYVYCQNSPLNYVDPSGLDNISIQPWNGPITIPFPVTLTPGGIGGAIIIIIITAGMAGGYKQGIDDSAWGAQAQQCREKCSKKLPGDPCGQGMEFFKCFNECMQDHGFTNMPPAWRPPQP